jgi:hypothetical protein
VVPGDGLGAALRRELDDAARRAPGLRTRCIDRELDALPTTSSCAIVLRIVHSTIGAALDAAPVSELEAIVEGGSTVATTVRVVSDDRDATQEALAVRLRDWLVTVDHVDGAWTLTRGSGSVALAFAVPADL